MLTIACCRVNYVCVQLEVNFTYISIKIQFFFCCTCTNPAPEHLLLYLYDMFRSFIRPSSVEDTVRPKLVVEK